MKKLRINEWNSIKDRIGGFVDSFNGIPVGKLKSIIDTLLDDFMNDLIIEYGISDSVADELKSKLKPIADNYIEQKSKIEQERRKALSKIKPTLHTKLQQYYISRFPDDDLGEDIDPYATFKDLLDAIDNGKDVYKVIGVGESDIRESLFEALAEILNVDYMTIYDKMMNRYN